MSQETAKRTELNPTTFTPLGDRALVRMDGREAVSGGGIIIPEKSREQALWGEVARVGPDCEGIAPGMRAYVHYTSGTKIVLDGVEYVLIREGEVLAYEEAA